MSSEEEQEEEEEGDVFNLETLPAVSLASMRGSVSEIGTTATSSQVMSRGSARRGSVVQVGGRSTALSESAELAVTLRRLKAANATGDANIMQAALTAAGAAAHMQGPEAAELQMLAMATASRLAEDKALVTSGQLRRSGEVRARVRRLWDLMVAETMLMRKQTGMEQPEDDEQDVTLEAYRNMHMRIAKILAFQGEFDEEEALKLADTDWAEDISRFSGTSHITVWLDEIRTKFKEASARAVAEHSFRQLFQTFDADGSGELDRMEFRRAVRDTLQISESTISEKELDTLFDAVDADGSGEVDSTEFVTWLFPAKLAKTPRGQKDNRNRRTRQEGHSKGGRRLVSTISEDALKQRFREASERMSQAVGWDLIFKKYDDDNSGELELDEFTRAVREECQLSEDAVPDSEIEELFGVIDSDQSGAIDSDELGELLDVNLGAGSMTFGPFYSSIFELVSVWVPDERESPYVRFLDHVFKAITVPVNGHELDLDTDGIPVFDDDNQLVPNFRLKQLEQCLSLVDDDGNLNIDDLETVNAQDILPENNPMSPAYIENKQAKNRERKQSLSATVSNSSLGSPKYRTGSNPELPRPSPREESLPVLAETETTGEEPEPEPEPADDVVAKWRADPAPIRPRKHFQARPPPPKLTMSDFMVDDSNSEKFGEGGWRRLAASPAASPAGNAAGTKVKSRYGDPRANVASHWTYGAAPPDLRYGLATAAPAAVGKGTQVGFDGGRKRLDGLQPTKPPDGNVSPPSVVAGKGKAQRTRPRPSVQVDAIIGTGPLSGRGLWSSGSTSARMPPSPPGTAGSRLATPRVLGAAGFRFAPPPRRTAGSGSPENSLHSVSTRAVRAHIAGRPLMEESWTSPFERIGGRIVPPMGPLAGIPNRPHTGHCTVQPHSVAAAAEVSNVLMRPAAVPADGSTAREALGYGEGPLYLHLIPGAAPGTPRSSRGLRKSAAGIALRTPLCGPGKPHRGIAHIQLDLPAVDMMSVVDTGPGPTRSGCDQGRESWGRLPHGRAALL